MMLTKEGRCKYSENHYIRLLKQHPRSGLQQKPASAAISS